MNIDFKYIYDYINHIDIECPNCSKKSVVKSNPENRKETKFICMHCGKSNIWKGESNSYEFGVHSQRSNGISIGQPVDCYFKFKLWYTTNFKGEPLFAYNMEHLNFLHSYINDKLRTRTKINGEWSNGSLQSRLPKWMLKADNREGIIKKLNELIGK